MKRFILFFLMGIGFATYVVAQTTSGFDFVVEEEDDEVVSDEAQPTEQVESAADENSENKNTANEASPAQEKQDTATVSSGKAETPPEETQENVKDEEETEEEKEKMIYLALNDVESTLAAVRSVSYCSGYFVLFNDTKKEIQEISGTIGIGDQTKDFKFTGVASGASVGWPIQIIGKACETIYGLPDIQIKKCQVKDMGEKRCRSKLVFVPITQN